MKKPILGLLGGAALIGSIILLPMNNSSASDGLDDMPEITPEKINVSTFVYALEKAEAEIEDEDLRQYYRLLIDSYELDQTGSSSGLISTDVLPEVNKIVRSAIELPLQEAGKNIRDPEIKEFYYDFLEDVGWEME